MSHRVAQVHAQREGVLHGLHDAVRAQRARRWQPQLVPCGMNDVYESRLSLGSQRRVHGWEIPYRCQGMSQQEWVAHHCGSCHFYAAGYLSYVI